MIAICEHEAKQILPHAVSWAWDKERQEVVATFDHNINLEDAERYLRPLGFKVEESGDDFTVSGKFRDFKKLYNEFRLPQHDHNAIGKVVRLYNLSQWIKESKERFAPQREPQITVGINGISIKSEAMDNREKILPTIREGLQALAQLTQTPFSTEEQYTKFLVTFPDEVTTPKDSRGILTGLTGLMESILSKQEPQRGR